MLKFFKVIIWKPQFNKCLCLKVNDHGPCCMYFEQRYSALTSNIIIRVYSILFQCDIFAFLRKFCSFSYYQYSIEYLFKHNVCFLKNQ